jgi:hypothetical protein
MTIELGHFAELRSDPHSGNKQAAVLIDTRPDDRKQQGSILEHPHLKAQLDRGERPDAVYLTKDVLDRLQQLRQKAARREQMTAHTAAEHASALLEDYRDPIGGEFAGRWLAACEPVFVGGRSPKAQDTGWVVIVQERYDDATAPVRVLGSRLVQQGLLALGVVIGVITLLWGFVVIVLTEAPRAAWMHSLRHRVGLPTTRTSGGSGGKAI